MNIDDYLLDVSEVDWSTALSPWLFLVPDEMTIWLVNQFGDIFTALEDGSIHMVDVGGGTFERVADSRDNFCDLLDDDDNGRQWFMIPFVDQLVEKGLSLGPGQCYGFHIPPVLGGEYTVDNIAVIPIIEHYAFHADIHQQIRDLPDGTPVKLKIVGSD